MSSDWDEIRRLAADLQRAQLSGAVQKLSERNCVEIVSRLCDLGLVEVSTQLNRLKAPRTRSQIRDTLPIWFFKLTRCFTQTTDAST